jgi:uncharacterized phage protein (predicted DNA packaging)
MPDLAFSDLTLVKQHIRVDHDAEDTLLETYLLAAEQAVKGHVQRPLYPRLEDMPLPESPAYDRHQMVVNDAIMTAVMLLTARLYDGRNGGEMGGGDATLPQPVRTLLAPYRVWHREVEDDGRE